MAKKKKTALCWLRNDLRLHDNEVIHEAAAQYEQVIIFYCFDDRQFVSMDEKQNKEGTKRYDHYESLLLPFKKTSAGRARFLIECLEDLRKSLEAKGSNIVIRQGLPAELISEFIVQVNSIINDNKLLSKADEIVKVFIQREPGPEEIQVENELSNALSGLEKPVPIQWTWGKTLFHIDDAPFSAADMPKTSKAFRIALDKQSSVRALIPIPKVISSPAFLGKIKNLDWGEIPAVKDLGFTTKETAAIKNNAFAGGELAALERLDYYTFKSELLTNYKFTRNKSLGKDFSSKLSPYLATGALSPRQVYWQVKEYEKKVKKNISTWWLVFEVVWRDYFYYEMMKFGSKVFSLDGIRNSKHPEFNEDYELFARWQKGQTGIPFIDAHMRELAQTGFMSNRGRVNCASFLSRDYQVDWRWGAAWFESLLLDYDVCSNWLNWSTQALEIYYTNPVWQGLKYDAKGEYVLHWLPELAEAIRQNDANQSTPLLQAPWLLPMVPGNYKAPVEIYAKWSWAIGRLKSAHEKRKGTSSKDPSEKKDAKDLKTIKTRTVKTKKTT